MKYVLRLLIVTTAIMTACGDDSQKDYLVTIKTNFGEMKAILYDETPKHKENFIKLAQESFYDSLLFHRVIKGFMVQGGDPDSRGAAPGQSLGSGGPGYTIPAEFNDQLFHVKGALSAARSPDQVNPEKASSGSQFYIVQGVTYQESELASLVENINYSMLSRKLNQIFQDGKQQELLAELIALQSAGDAEGLKKKVFESLPVIEAELGEQTMKTLGPEQKGIYTTIGGYPSLDGDYTVFGKVISGLDVLDQIAAQATDPNDRPLEDIYMVVAVEQVSKKKITEQYGYTY